MDLKNKKITVIGMGRSGIASANFLAGKKSLVTLIDQKEQKYLEEAVAQVNPSVAMKFEADSLPGDEQLIVLSPGIDIHSSFLESARGRGIPIWSEIELASRFTTTPIIAVTGTNGKTTCTTLIGKILQKAGKKVLLGGNIGIPFISLVDQKETDYLVLEISSFQLEAIEKFHPKISVVLNITPDHLDRHKTLATYIALKARIHENQTGDDFCILNVDDANTKTFGQNSPAKKFHFSAKEKVGQGTFVEENHLMFIKGGIESKICAISDLSQVMQWQVENVLAASLVCSLLDIPAECIAQSLKQFTGMEHRMEWVRTFRGIDFVNDSKGTNVGAVQKSLESLSRPIVLIAGGKDKDSDFLPLKQTLKQKVKHLILIGETRSKFRQALNGSFSYEDADSMEEAVRQAVGKAEPGDVVLLSPACASFDMFKDYADRGSQFKTIVHQL
ncbi:UDP-N-acetylmuramoylalanine--D-glutamate ligase [hydrothermal vent metagenome]|uniref:UDP-N-acetylmuramoylalanine--D-glutamate ligase n=1 Tax=hydrothermal vent metagenome TaxID=652676 RepID=A0A3B1D9F0_9ZZZZ